MLFFSGARLIRNTEWPLFLMCFSLRNLCSLLDEMVGKGRKGVMNRMFIQITRNPFHIRVYAAMPFCLPPEATTDDYHFDILK